MHFDLTDDAAKVFTEIGDEFGLRGISKSFSGKFAFEMLGFNTLNLLFSFLLCNCYPDVEDIKTLFLIPH